MKKKKTVNLLLSVGTPSPFQLYVQLFSFLRQFLLDFQFEMQLLLLPTEIEVATFCVQNEWIKQCGYNEDHLTHKFINAYNL